MFDRSPNFLNDTDGAVTVDWVVISAAIVTLAALFMSDMTQKIDTASAGIATKMAPIIDSMSSLGH